MKLYSVGGEILYAVYNRDMFLFQHTTNVAMQVYSIDEITENAALCADIRNTLGKRDVRDKKKYRIDENGILNVEDDWHEDISSF